MIDNDFSKLKLVQELAGTAQVSYAMHYCYGPNDFYFTIDSPAPSDCYISKNHSFDIAVDNIIEFLTNLQPIKDLKNGREN